MHCFQNIVVFLFGIVAVKSAVIGLAPGLLGTRAALVAHDTPIVAPGILAGGVIAARGLVASPLTASGYPLLAAGSGIEGQYIHDIRGELQEGQYIHDFTETLADNGQYHGEIYA